MLAPAMDQMVDMRRYLPPQYRTDKSHEALWFPEVTSADRFDDNQKSIVDLIIDLLPSELTAQIKADAFGEQAVQLFHRRFVAAVDSVDESGPIHGTALDLCRSGFRWGGYRLFLGAVDRHVDPLLCPSRFRPANSELSHCCNHLRFTPFSVP